MSPPTVQEPFEAIRAAVMPALMMPITKVVLTEPWFAASKGSLQTL